METDWGVRCGVAGSISLKLIKISPYVFYIELTWNTKKKTVAPNHSTGEHSAQAQPDQFIPGFCHRHEFSRYYNLYCGSGGDGDDMTMNLIRKV